ncbi:SIMPL domain-containing protein [Paracoccus sp. (in: a-proteobacteria)]|uniref:SIMPL domain-containing protein n=1 Tax=Paracoccus sp. TaxID=267 RepID=UPI00321F9B2A
MPRFRPLLTAATLLALTTAPLLAQAQPAKPQHQDMGHQMMKQRAPSARLSVTGQGHATAQPDMAMITLGVSTQAATAAEAMEANASQQGAVIGTLKAQGIEARDIQTSGLNLAPQMDFSVQGQPPKLTGYVAQNSVTVRVRDLAGLGAVLDKLVASGANQISGISFLREDMTAAGDAARSAAVADARHRAEIMAEAAGMKLGRLVALSDSRMIEGPRPMMAMAAEARSAGTPIEAGELEISANVTAVFAMRPAGEPEAGQDPEPEAEAGEAPAN